MGKHSGYRRSNVRPLASQGGGQGKLVNNLTIADAQHLLRNEGGEMTVLQTVQRLMVVLVVAYFSARAIYLGEATATHLMLPMLGEYLVLLLTLPLLYAVMRHPAMRKDARSSVVLWIFFTLGFGLWVCFQMRKSGLAWPAQAGAELRRFWDWIVSHQMHWPMLGAAAGMLVGLPNRVRLLLKHGPPFTPVGLGCGMRIALLVLGAFVLPFLLGSSERLTWGLWTLLVLAEIVTLVMLWDIQRRLKKRGRSLNGNDPLPL